MQSLAGDKPIRTPKEDLFGMSSFAKALAKSLLEMSPEDGIAISVEAPWGAGKSSAIALTVLELQFAELISLGMDRKELNDLSAELLADKWKNEPRRKTHIVRFNPWMFSGQENLVRAFFKELEVQVGVGAQTALSKSIGKIASYLPSAMGFLGAGIGIAAGGLAGGGVGATAGGKAGDIAAKALGSDQSLEVLKRELASELQKADLRIIVIIDDLDRLLPSEMRLVFSLVKSLGDLPKIFYLLAFDQKVVLQALQNGLEKVDSDFLEKIVQVSLKLPPPWRSELQQLFVSRLEAVIGDTQPADEDRWRRMFLGAIDPYLETPRDVTRLANTLQVIWPNVVGDVDITDLVAITTLQLFEPEVYALIRDEIEVITNADFRYEDEKSFGKRMDPTFAKKPAVAKHSMALLFPRLAKAWDGFMEEGTYYIVQKEHRRVCTKEYHRNYFVFGRDGRMLTRSEIESVVYSADPSSALTGILNRLIAAKSDQGSNLVASLLEQMCDTLYSKPALTPALLRAILDHSDELISREDFVWEIFVRNNHDRLSSIIRLGTEPLKPEERSSLLSVLSEHPKGLEIRSHTIEGDAREHGLFGKPPREWEQRFKREEVETAVRSVGDQIASAFKDGLVWEMPDPVRLLWRWWRIGDKEGLKAWLPNVFANPEWVIKFAEKLPSTSYQEGSGGRKIIRGFRRSRYKELFEVNDLYSVLNSLAKSNDRAAKALKDLREAEVEEDDEL